MGKTLTQLAIIGAAVAVNFVPGVGQAISGFLITSTPLAIGSVAAVTSAIITGITVAGIAAGVNLAASVLGLYPGVPKPDTTATSIKAPIPPRVGAFGRSRLYGAYVLFETAGNGTAVDVFAIKDGSASAILAVYLGDDIVTLSGSAVNAGADGRYGGGALNVYYNLGNETETAFADIVALLPGVWTAAHRGDGVVTAALTAKSIKSKGFQKIYPSSNIPTLSLVGDWELCFDPRDPGQDVADRNTWEWTRNPVLHLLFYKLVRENVDYATEILPNLAYWITAADDCDSPVALKAGGTDPRYQSDVVYRLTDAHKDTISSLLTTFDGWIARDANGAFIVYSGRFYEPTVAIGSDEISSYSWGYGVAEEDAIDRIAVSYQSADHDYQAVQTDDWVIGNGDNIDTFSPAVPSWGLARRLAKRKASRLMALMRGTVTTTVAGRIVIGQRYIDLRIEEAGSVFFAGPAEIVTVERNLATGGVTFDWIAADPAIDEWNPATEEGDPAPVGDRIASEPLDTPTITAATATFGTIGGTDSILDPSDVSAARITITGSGPARDDLTWYGRWCVSPSGAWSEDAAEDADPTSGVTITTGYVAYGTSVDVEIAYQVGDGRISDWSAPTTVSTTP